MTQTRSEAESRPPRPAAGRSGGPAAAIARVARFLREVVAELAKVIWPNRSDLITYAVVVIVFLVVMIAIVAGLDLGFAKLVVAVFGG